MIEESYSNFLEKNIPSMNKVIFYLDNGFRILFIIMTTIFLLYSLLTDNIYLFVVTAYAAFAALFIITNWIEKGDK